MSDGRFRLELLRYPWEAGTHWDPTDLRRLWLTGSCGTEQVLVLDTLERSPSIRHQRSRRPHGHASRADRAWPWSLEPPLEDRDRSGAS